jgi:ribonucleotide reductase alpha subunit
MTDLKINMENKRHVVKRSGELEEIDINKINKRIVDLSKDLKNIDVFSIVQSLISTIHDKITTSELDTQASSLCVEKNTIHPEYDILATRFIISNLHKNTSSSFSEVTQILFENEMISEHYYKNVIKNKVKYNNVINKNENNDYNYNYFGFKTLERAYLLKLDGKIIERPQHMLMRVAIGIHENNFKEAIKTYKQLSDGYFTHATPTLFNMGTNRQQGSSCFLLTIKEDSIEGIYDTLKDCAKISKNAGGEGISVSDIRAKGTKIKGTNGTSNGIVPMLKNFNETARYVDQGGGKRNGSFAIYLEPWHSDIHDFIMLKKNVGAETERARDLFYALWIPDLFMKRIEEDSDWTLMCPHKCPGLTECYGDAFEELYCKYEQEGKGNKTVRARTLWYEILDSQIETGTPYMLYKDSCNRKSNQNNLGTIKSSNLCCEIIEYTSKDEIAVCNLASIALPKFIEESEFNFKKFEEVVKTVTRNLNKIIDINYYPVKEAETSNKRHRPIGIGIQGLADVFAILKIPFDSHEAKELNKRIFGYMYLYALETSVDIAKKRKKLICDYKKLLKTNEDNIDLNNYKKENYIIEEELELPDKYAGSYSSFMNSPIQKNKLQFDLWEKEPLEELKEKFNKVKEDIKKHGIRNSLLIAPMPTASTSQILGNNECFEPFTSNIYSRNTLAGSFVVINKHLIKDLLELKLWNKEMKNKIIENEGSVQNIKNIPDNIKSIYKTVWEIKQKDIIDMAADRGIYIDQSQSMNIFIKSPTYKILTGMHFHGWKSGLKTGMYYLRIQTTAKTQQFTIEQTEEPVQACSRDNPDCEACGS